MIMNSNQNLQSLMIEISELEEHFKPLQSKLKEKRELLKNMLLKEKKSISNASNAERTVCAELKPRFSSFKYVEDDLRVALGQEYKNVLIPDAKKMRASLPYLIEYLDPVLEKIGKPDHRKVLRLVESGLAGDEVFETLSTRVYALYIKGRKTSCNR